MLNERSCGCNNRVVCCACFRAASNQRRLVAAGNGVVPRWLASPFRIRRQLTSREIDHRRRMQAHLAARA
jgi:hypothetical protein